jgi:hypothetical protein
MSRKAAPNRLTPDADLAAWCAVLSEAKPADKVPDGWLTAKQIAEKTGKALSTIGSQLCHAVSQGRCERKSFRIQTGDMVRPVPHYKLKQ